MRNFMVYCLLFILLILASCYISIVEGVIIWGFWNYLITEVISVPTVSYLNSVGFLTILNLIFLGYRSIRLWNTL
jgi:hypothetical protein